MKQVSVKDVDRRQPLTCFSQKLPLPFMNRARRRVVPIKVVSLGSENNDQHKRFPEIKTCQRLIYFRTVLTHLSLSFLMIAISVSLHQPSAWPSKIYMISFKARKRQSLVNFR